MRVRMLGGPTIVVEIGGSRLLTDPTFDPPGEYPGRSGYSLVKTASPAVRIDELPPIDAVLLSHDQHVDNLDHAGRALLSTVPTVLSTRSAAQRLPDIVTPLAPWSAADFATAHGGNLRITAVPAQHGPDNTDHLTGEVIGFVLQGAGVPTIYVSGDNASLRIVREISERIGKIDVALLHAGAASTPLIPGEYLTLTSEQAAEAAKILDARRVFVVHTDSWAHFTQTADDVRRAFAEAGVSDRLLGCEPGEVTVSE